jgi:hypothetical protein
MSMIKDIAENVFGLTAFISIFSFNVIKHKCSPDTYNKFIKAVLSILFISGTVLIVLLLSKPGTADLINWFFVIGDN